MREIDCSNCGATHSEAELREENKPVGKSGKIDLDCPDCGAEAISIQYYCNDCDEWTDGRMNLEKYDTGTVAKYACPHCDGIIRKGNILEKRQGQQR